MSFPFNERRHIGCPECLTITQSQVSNISPIITKGLEKQEIQLKPQKVIVLCACVGASGTFVSALVCSWMMNKRMNL